MAGNSTPSDWMAISMHAVHHEHVKRFQRPLIGTTDLHQRRQMRSCEVVAGATLPAVRRFFRVPRDRRHHATGEIVNPWPVVGIEVFFVLGTFGLAASVASATNLYTAVATALVGYLVGIAITRSLARLVRRRVERSIKPRGWEYVVEAVGP